MPAMIGVSAGPCWMNQLSASATSLMPLAMVSGGMRWVQSTTMVAMPPMASAMASHAALKAVTAPLSLRDCQSCPIHWVMPPMAFWTMGTALVMASERRPMPPVTAGLTSSSMAAPSLMALASRLPMAPSMVAALVAASTAASVKPSCMMASLNSCALISPWLMASRKLPV